MMPYPVAAARGHVFQQAVAGFSGPLDGVDDIVVAFSMRRLLASYEGNCLKLRRASDDAESDFGFDANGDLDIAAIATFLSATTGYGVTWYDQSGNGVNASQSVDADQPLFVASAINSRPTFLLDGSGDFLAYLTPTNIEANDPKSIYAVYRGTESVGDGNYIIATRVNYGGVNNTGRGYLVLCASSVRYSHTGAGDAIKNSAETHSTPTMFAALMDADGANTTLYVNGADQAPLDTDTIGAGTNELANGYTAIGQQAGDFPGGDIAEQVVASGHHSAGNRQAVETAMNAYWSIW